MAKILFLILVGGLLPGLAGNAQEPEPRTITIGTGGLTGVYFPLGGAICRLVSREDKAHAIRCLVGSTEGSVFNLKALREGRLDIALAQSDQQYNAYYGKGAFAALGPDPELRALFSTHSEPFTVVARAGSGIRTFDDLEGKRVNVGTPGSGQRATLDALLLAKGWTLSTFAATLEQDPSEQAKALCDDKVDAIFYAAGHPNRSVLEATIACDSRLVPVTGPAVDKLVAENPYYTKTVIPGGLYRGNPDPVPTFGVKATVVSSAKVSAEIIYQVVRSVFENLDELHTLYPALARESPLTMLREGNSAPLHPGARRYFQEAGLLNP